MSVGHTAEVRIVTNVRPAKQTDDIARTPGQMFRSLRARREPRGADLRRIREQSLPEPIAAGQVMTTSAGPTGPTLTGCRRNTRSTAQYGWVFDHFTYCNYNRWVVAQTECVNNRCREVGSAEFRLIFLGKTFPGSRRAEFSLLTDQWRTFGAIPPSNIVGLGLGCRGEGSGTCRETGQDRFKTIAQWMAQRNPINIRVESSEEGALGIDQLTYTTFFSRVTHGDKKTDLLNGFRCDSATYLAGGRGCVFDLVTERWSGLSVKNSAVDSVAKHIRAAQRTAGMPGSTSSGRPLERLKSEYAPETVGANRSAARRACSTLRPKPGTQCDEYPFASTREGGSSGGPFSVRRVNDSDNVRAGGKLVQWYSSQRMLHQDDFYVIVRK